VGRVKVIPSSPTLVRWWQVAMGTRECLIVGDGERVAGMGFKFKKKNNIFEC
jgi:hypothetical protein